MNTKEAMIIAALNHLEENNISLWTREAEKEVGLTVIDSLMSHVVDVYQDVDGNKHIHKYSIGDEYFITTTNGTIIKPCRDVESLIEKLCLIEGVEYD